MASRFLDDLIGNRVSGTDDLRDDLRRWQVFFKVFWLALLQFFLLLEDEISDMGGNGECGAELTFDLDT